MMKNFEIKNNSLFCKGRGSQSGLTLLPESGADAPTVLSAVYTDSTPAKNRQADVPQYGRSMIEMLGVLAIIGVLSVGGIAGYSKAMMKYRINKTIEQITLIAGNVRTFFATQRSYSGLDNTILKKAKLVPDEMWNSGKTGIDSAFGHGVSISAEESGSLITVGTDDYDYRAFQIIFSSLPVEACIELTTQDWSNAQVAAIGIENYESGGVFKTPIGIDVATQKCAQFAKDGEVDVKFHFDIDINSNYWKNQFSM